MKQAPPHSKKSADANRREKEGNGRHTVEEVDLIELCTSQQPTQGSTKQYLPNEETTSQRDNPRANFERNWYKRRSAQQDESEVSSAKEMERNSPIEPNGGRRPPTFQETTGKTIRGTETDRERAEEKEWEEINRWEEWVDRRRRQKKKDTTTRHRKLSITEGTLPSSPNLRQETSVRYESFEDEWYKTHPIRPGDNVQVNQEEEREKGQLDRHNMVLANDSAPRAKSVAPNDPVAPVSLETENKRAEWSEDVSKIRNIKRLTLERSCSQIFQVAPLEHRRVLELRRDERPGRPWPKNEPAERSLVVKNLVQGRTQSRNDEEATGIDWKGKMKAEEPLERIEEIWTEGVSRENQEYLAGEIALGIQALPEPSKTEHDQDRRRNQKIMTHLLDRSAPLSAWIEEVANDPHDCENVSSSSSNRMDLLPEEERTFSMDEDPPSSVKERRIESVCQTDESEGIGNEFKIRKMKHLRDKQWNLREPLSVNCKPKAEENDVLAAFGVFQEDERMCLDDAEPLSVKARGPVI